MKEKLLIFYSCPAAKKRNAEITIEKVCTIKEFEKADYLKKVYGHGHKYDHSIFIKEVGDVLWYIADLCTRHGVDLETIAKQNIIKLENRYPNGFSSEKSINRAEV